MKESSKYLVVVGFVAALLVSIIWKSKPEANSTGLYGELRIDERSGRSDSKVIRDRKLGSIELGRQRTPDFSGRELEKLMFESPQKLVEILESMDRRASAALINSCGRIVRNEIEAGGDFERVGKLMISLPSGVAKQLMLAWVIGSASKEGKVYDFTEQRKMIAKLGMENELDVYQRFLSVSGGSAARELVVRRHDLGLVVDDLGGILCGAVSEKGVTSSFAAMQEYASSGEFGVQAVANRVVARMLAENSEETSKLIGCMDAGEARDTMIRPMVVWLAKKKEVELAARWAELLEQNEVNSVFQRKIAAARVAAGSDLK